MAIGITPSETYTYRLRSDLEAIEAAGEDAEKRAAAEAACTVFELGHLDARQQAKLADNGAIYDANPQDTTRLSFRPLRGTTAMEALRAGLRGWSNFVDADGKEIPFKTEGRQLNVLGRDLDPPSYPTLSCLTPDQRDELAEVIQNGGHLTEDDRKN